MEGSEWISRLWSTLLTVIAAAIGFWNWVLHRDIGRAMVDAKDARDTALSTKDSLSNHELHSANNYVKKDELNASISRLERKFESVEEKLDLIKDRLPPKAQ